MRTEWIHRPQPAMMGVGIGVVEQVNGISGFCLPTEQLDQAISVDAHDALIVREPVNGVVHEAEQIAVAGEPIRAFDVAGEVGCAA